MSHFTQRAEAPGMVSLMSLLSLILMMLSLSSSTVHSFSIHGMSSATSAASVSARQYQRCSTTTATTMTTTVTRLQQSINSEVTSSFSFIETELRGAAMRLHTTMQAPKEGKVVVENTPPTEKYIPTLADYLQFLVDSLHVYQAFEHILQQSPALRPFQATPLDRVQPLEQDIDYLCSTFDLPRPTVGTAGTWYADHLHSIATCTPQFMCHYYNFYFAHTAGGRMIGKQMASLLLDKKTLEFYKWNGDLNDIKNKIKADIEIMAAAWNEGERKQCVDATAMAFRGGGGINSYLNGGKRGH
jgi:heme oxygenase (biliverdin-producing, ferredoxin)